MKEECKKNKPMARAKVSVIVPVYNTGIYLEQCLKSLLSQTLKEIEIICVNDGSSDNSLEILERLATKDNRIKIINKKNAGQSAARNDGMKIASGEYIGFLDSDDYASNDMFEKLYKNALRFESDISMCSIRMFDEKNESYDDSDPYMTLDLFPKTFEKRSFACEDAFGFLFRICVVPWNKIFKKSFLDKNCFRFVEGLNFEDNVFFLDTFLKGKKISILKENLVVYRKCSKTSYSHSLQSSQDEKKFDFFKIFELQEEILKKNGIYEELKEDFETTRKNTLVYWYKKLTDENCKKRYAEMLTSSIY